MSTILYGRLSRTVESTQALQRQETQPETPAQRAAALAQQVAGLVPAEVLVIHGIVLAASTEVGEDGSTTVTEPEGLKWSLPILAGVALLLYVIGRWGPPGWKTADWVRMLVPPVAFGAWTLLTGTSAATPWLGDLARVWVWLIGGVVAVLVLAVAARVTPKAT